MLTPEEFRDRWGGDGELDVFPPGATADLKAPPETKRFLNEVGLPEAASPFLEFQAPEDGPLPTSAQEWNLGPEFARYREIGFNGSGDPVCLDESSDAAVVYLNSDDNFARVFVNSSVPQLAESLLAYRHLVKDTQRRNGPDAFLDGNVSEDLRRWLRDELARIDPAAVEDGFWADEVENLDANAQ